MLRKDRGAQGPGSSGGRGTPGVLVVRREFVVALLNDLFGIQCRGGCSCAGPYGHRLLGIDTDRAYALASQAVGGWLGIKPGWTRLSSASISPMRSSTSSWRRCTWWPPTGSGCCRSTASTRAPACGATATRAILAAHPTGNGHAHAAALPGQFERLRWFELPGACLTATRAG